MNNRALKKYIEEKYFVKIKKAKIWGLNATLINTTYYVITKKEQLDHLSSGCVLKELRLFERLTDILDFLEEKIDD